MKIPFKEFPEFEEENKKETQEAIKKKEKEREELLKKAIEVTRHRYFEYTLGKKDLLEAIENFKNISIKKFDFESLSKFEKAKEKLIKCIERSETDNWRENLYRDENGRDDDYLDPYRSYR